MNSDLRFLRRLVQPSFPVLDFHTHPLANFGPDSVTTVEEDASLLVAAARRAGVSRLVTFSLHPACPQTPTMAQCVEANDYALRMRDVEPEVIVPFCYVTPEFPRAAVRELERCVGGREMAGIKLWVACRASDSRLDPIIGKAVELGVPVVQHAWRKTLGQLAGESYPRDVADLACRFPRARLVMAHLNGVNPRGIEAVRGCQNVLIDTSGGDPECGMVAFAVKRLGSQRVVYGSDSPIRHPAVMLSKVLAASLTEQELRDVLWNNAARLLPVWTGVQRL